MKKKLVSTSFFIFFNTFAQVGINTPDPTRSLHVQGNLKVVNLKNASEDAAFERILVSDPDGNVDYANRKVFLPSGGIGAVDKESYSEIYNNDSTSGIVTKKLKCGKFFFVFNETTSSNIMFGLNEQPASTVNIYMNMEQNWNGNGFQFYQGTNSTNGTDTPFSFTTSNYNTPQEFKSSNLALYEQNVMTFQYPGDQDIYRLTIYKVGHTSNSYDFVSACEKF